MRFRKARMLILGVLAATGGAMSAQATSAYLFWMPPDFHGEPVRGDEPGIGLPLPGATSAEIRAHLIWNLRAGLNVAALQCQFSPVLMTVRNYNDVLTHHSAELASAYTTLTAYFRRTGGKTWQNLQDQYTTRTYNGFSTLRAQLGFCETAASIGREVLGRRKGELYMTAENRMREFRNSLVPIGDRLDYLRMTIAPQQIAPLAAACWDKKGRFRADHCSMPVGT